MYIGFVPAKLLEPLLEYMKNPFDWGRTCPPDCKCSAVDHNLPNNLHYICRHPGLEDALLTFFDDYCEVNSAVAANGFYEMSGRPVGMGQFL